MIVPKLRFSQFTEDWEEMKFMNVATSFEYGMNAAAKEYDGISKYIRITDIDDKTHRYVNTSIVSPDANLEEKYVVNEGDILLARTGASTGKSYLYSPRDGLLYFAGFLIKMSVSKIHDSRFVFSQTLTGKYKRWVGITSMRSGQPGINSQEYASYKSHYPKLLEQQKIADFLSLIDRKIELQEKKTTLLKDYKKGVLKHIFKQCNSKQFRIEKLKNICTITTGKLDANAMKPNGCYRFYTCAREYYLIDEFAFDTEALLISGNGANVGYIHHYKGKFNAYQRTYVLCNISENIHYIKVFLEMNLAKRISTQKNEGNTPYIVLGTLTEMDIHLLDQYLQISIVELNNRLNCKLNLENTKFQELVQLKSALLQQMFI